MNVILVLLACLKIKLKLYTPDLIFIICLCAAQHMNVSLCVVWILKVSFSF
jgi:hypothetical protein